jgi:hypothetical protein
MELTYRGVRYVTTAPSLEVTSTSEQGMFLGAPFHRKRYQGTPPSTARVPLQFLGRPYIG